MSTSASLRLRDAMTRLRDGETAQLPRWLVAVAPWALAAGTWIYLALANLDAPLLGRAGAPAFLGLAALLAAGLAAWGAARGRGVSLTAAELTVAACLAGAIVADAGQFDLLGLRDFGIYLHAGDHLLAGGAVYDTVPLGAYPEDLSRLPFLYPPPVLPLFALLARLPFPMAASIWVGGCAVAVAASLRAFGMPWRWVAAAFLWLPVFQGLYVGNVAVPALLLFALAPRVPALLALGPVFKPQAAILALWLPREGRWRSLALGLGVLAVICVATLPLTGVDRWSEWLQGLATYGASERNVPGLYGLALARMVPLAAVVLIAAVALLLALRARGLDGLGRLGVASIVASPSLYTHGFLVAIPDMLRLDAPWLWLAVAMSSTRGPLPGWTWLPFLLVAAWVVPGLRRSRNRAGWPHPLDGMAGPWAAPGPEGASSARMPGPAPLGDPGLLPADLEDPRAGGTAARRGHHE